MQGCPGHTAGRARRCRLMGITYLMEHTAPVLSVWTLFCYKGQDASSLYVSCCLLLLYFMQKPPRIYPFSCGGTLTGFWILVFDRVFCKHPWGVPRGHDLSFLSGVHPGVGLLGQRASLSHEEYIFIVAASSFRRLCLVACTCISPLCRHQTPGMLAERI